MRTKKPIRSLSTLNVNELLAHSNPTDYIYVANLPKGGKVPKSIIDVYAEKNCGLTEIKTTFIKKGDNDSVYWANDLGCVTTISGKPQKGLLFYYLFYNDQNLLIKYSVKRVDAGKKYKDKHYSSNITLPPAEKVCRVIVYVGPHPNEYTDFSLLDFLK